MKRALFYGLLFAAAVAVGTVASIPVHHPCCVCGETAYVEPLLAVPFADISFVHFECAGEIPYDPTVIEQLREEFGR